MTKAEYKLSLTRGEVQLYAALQIILLVVKLTGWLPLDWLWILLPLWGPMGLTLLFWLVITFIRITPNR